MRKLTFPEGFLWGAASASYQVEGAVNEDGRGESIWDRYCSVPDNVAKGESGETACDHYHRYKDDIALMKQAGLKAYRFSVSWPRIYPNGTGEINEKGLAFYVNLADELLKNEIEPCLTLYHWDLPQAMQDIGGWANPAMPGYFLQYARTVMKALSGKVRYWITLNEPYCAAFLGNYVGRQAPGLRDFSTAVLVAYHLYVAHGRTVEYFRQADIPGEIGIALNLMGRRPYSSSPEDQQAALHADGYLNRWFADPIFKGAYPQDMIDLYRQKGVRLPHFDPQELTRMHLPLDFVGINYYNDFYVQSRPQVWPLGFEIVNPPHLPVNQRDWPITEDGFHHMLMRLTKEYGAAKIMVTENGTATNDIIGIDGQVDDAPRVDYLKRHIRKLHQAIQDGAPVMGYMHWSFSDNFEWSFGYDSRFGLVFIDYRTQERILKRSAHWYTNVIRTNAIEV